MDVEQLIQSVDMVEYISNVCDVEFELRNGEYWACSPFKPENTPSFSVRPEVNLFFDFSSGKSGGLITFIQDYFHLSKYQAVEKLKEYTGLEGELTQRKHLAALSVAKRFSPPKTYTKEEKATVLADDYMDRYEMRPDKLAVWEAEGISKASLERFQVRYDAFSDRLVYPIRDLTGRIVNVGGRTLDPKWKEKKLRKYTYFFSWGSMNTIYGVSENLSDILEHREVILFEGAKSVMLADSWGIRNTGAILTSHLSANQLKLLIKLGVKVVFALDKEIDIREDKNISKLRQFTTVQYLYDRDGLLGEKEAPVDRGLEVFQKLYEGRRTWR